MIESEKYLEVLLIKEVKRAGGWAIKLLPGLITGLPDRLVLLPGGKIAFAEIKTTGKKPTKIQKVVHKQIRDLGFYVWVLDSTERINEFIKVTL